MIQQVRNSGMMDADMKVSLKMANSMAKVSDLLDDLLILTLFDDLIGKWFGNNGDRYEGEYKDGFMHGQGKKYVIYLIIYWF